jgi:hypothetical protein
VTAAGAGFAASSRGGGGGRRRTNARITSATIAAAPINRLRFTRQSLHAAVTRHNRGGACYDALRSITRGQGRLSMELFEYQRVAT